MIDHLNSLPLQSTVSLTPNLHSRKPWGGSVKSNSLLQYITTSFTAQEYSWTLYSCSAGQDTTCFYETQNFTAHSQMPSTEHYYTQTPEKVKAKLFLCLTALQRCVGEWSYSSTFLNLSTMQRWAVSCPCPFTPDTYCIGGWAGVQSRSGCYGDNKTVLPQLGINLRFLGCPVP
jgi:hypothetical protein